MGNFCPSDNKNTNQSEMVVPKFETIRKHTVNALLKLKNNRKMTQNTQKKVQCTTLNQKCQKN
jgi:hypothetical protein